VREEKKEGRQLRADHIDSLEMVVTLLPAGCCCSEKEETLDPPKIAHRCNGLPEASHRHVLKTHPGSSPTPVSPAHHTSNFSTEMPFCLFGLQ